MNIKDIKCQSVSALFNLTTSIVFFLLIGCASKSNEMLVSVENEPPLSISLENDSLTFSLQESGNQKTERFILKMSDLFDKNKIEKPGTIEEFERFLSENPDNWITLMEFSDNQGYKGIGRVLYFSAVNMGADKKKLALFDLSSALKLLGKKEYEKSSIIAMMAYAKDSTNPHITSLIGADLIALGSFSNAIEYFNKSLKYCNDTSKPFLYLAIAKSYLLMNDFDRVDSSLSLFEMNREYASDNDLYEYNLLSGKQYLYQGNKSKACEHLKLASQYEKNSQIDSLIRVSCK